METFETLDTERRLTSMRGGGSVDSGREAVRDFELLSEVSRHPGSPFESVAGREEPVSKGLEAVNAAYRCASVGTATSEHATSLSQHSANVSARTPFPPIYLATAASCTGSERVVV